MSARHRSYDFAKYRPDIDGLRAVAVAPVVLYHSGVTGFGGGYVGVDVFFVISGFLITSLIIGEMNEGRFSILSFYERRARRILPALLATIAIALLAGSLFLFSTDFRNLTGSAIATSLFYSNLYFWQTSSYFATGSHLKPLLHTWSLAIEEQFYIIFPAFLLFVAWAGGRFLLWLGSAFLASLALSAWGTLRYPDAAFYLAPTRAWELLTGALLALGLVPAIADRRLREALGLAGISMILWAIFRFDHATIFPGVAALLPCLGAAFVIQSRGSAVNRLLGLRPLVFVGLISYSLYLWHWPILVFARYQGYFLGTPAQTTWILAASFAAAILSWRFIEKPFRTRRLLPDRRPLLGSAVLGMAAMILAAFSLGELRDTNARAATEALAKGRAEARAAYGEGLCFFSSNSSISAIRPADCLAPDPTKPDYLLVGDSLAAQLWPGLSEALPQANVTQLTFGGCPPLPSAMRYRVPGCRKVIRSVLAAIERHRYDVLLLAARWQPDDGDELEQTIRRLKPSVGKIVLFGPMVEYRADLPEILRDKDHPQQAAEKYRTVPTVEDRKMRGFADRLGIRYVSLVDLMCPDVDRCIVFDKDHRPIQWDNVHLTAEGSAQLMDRAMAEGSIPGP